MVVDEVVEHAEVGARSPRRRAGAPEEGDGGRRPEVAPAAQAAVGGAPASSASGTAPEPGGEVGRRGGWNRRRVLLVVGGLVVGWVGFAALTGGGVTRSSTSVARSLSDRSGPANGPATKADRGPSGPVPAAGAGGSAARSPAGIGAGGGAVSTGGVASAAGSAAGAGAGMPAASSAPVVPAPVPLPAAAAPELPTRVIKTATVALEVKRGGLGAAVEQVTAQAAGAAGFVASSQTSEGDAPSGTITVRVPAPAFEALVARVRGLGRVLSAGTGGQDVTAQLVDLASRIDALKAARQQYLTVLSRASNIGDILNVQQHINDLQVQVEQLQGQQKVLDDQASFSTLTVQLTEKGAPVMPLPRPTPAAGGLRRALHQAASGFTGGIERLVAVSGIVAFLVVLALLGGAGAVAGRWVWMGARRRLS